MQSNCCDVPVRGTAARKCRIALHVTSVFLKQSFFIGNVWIENCPDDLCVGYVGPVCPAFMRTSMVPIYLQLTVSIGYLFTFRAVPPHAGRRRWPRTARGCRRAASRRQVDARGAASPASTRPANSDGAHCSVCKVPSP